MLRFTTEAFLYGACCAEKILFALDDSVINKLKVGAKNRMMSFDWRE